jgi:hypothetical protein
MTLPTPTHLTDASDAEKALRWLGTMQVMYRHWQPAADNAYRVITSLQSDLQAAKAEIERWKASFGGHLYVTNEDYSALANRANTAEADLQRTRDALTKCTATFREYAQLHRAKNTEDGDVKARRNEEMMTMCATALILTPPTGT